MNVPDAGAVHWSKPTAKKGGAEDRLVYLPPDQEITPANAAGKVVIRDFQHRFASLRRCRSARWASTMTPDLDGLHATTRGPTSSPNAPRGPDGRRAWPGRRESIFAFDVPGKQVRGYYDPHVGTLYRVPAVFVGSAQATQLKALAAQGSSARVTVLAKVARTKTRNLIARLPGQSPEKIVLAANTDGNSWVQENGVIGMLAFARYYAKLPKRCHPRTLRAGVLERSRRVPRRRA